MIKIGSNNVTSDISRQVSSIVDSQISGIQADVNGLRYTVGDLSSNLQQKNVYFESKFIDLDYRLRTVLNVTGVGSFR